MKHGGLRAAGRWRIAIVLLAAIGLGLAGDALREERVFFPRKAPAVRHVPGASQPW